MRKTVMGSIRFLLLSLLVFGGGLYITSYRGRSTIFQ